MQVGPLIISLSTTKLLAKEILLLESPHVGGLVLFKENYNESAESPKDDLKKLIQKIQQIRKNKNLSPLLIMIDHERRTATTLSSCAIRWKRLFNVYTSTWAKIR